MRGAGGRVKVAKNRLVKLALEGTDVEGIAALFKGPTAIAYLQGPDRGAEDRGRIRQDEREARRSSAAGWASTLLDAQGSRRWPSCRRSTS